MALIAEISNRFSIFDLKKWGYITQGTRRGSSKWTYCSQESSISFWVVIDGINDYIRLMYHLRDCYTGEEKDIDYQVSLCKTPCNYGGHRYWFICPECKRRCGTYFLRGNGFCAGNEEGFYLIPRPSILYQVRTLIEHFQKLNGFIIKGTLPENTGNISG